MVHFDAHCDTWEDHFSEPSGHGTWVYEAIQEGLVIPECFVQIGIRSPGEKHTLDYVADQGGIIYTARDLRGHTTTGQLQEVSYSTSENYYILDHLSHNVILSYI